MKMRSGISSHKPTNAIHPQSRSLLATSLDIAMTPAPMTGGDSRSAAGEKRNFDCALLRPRCNATFAPSPPAVGQPILASIGKTSSSQ